MDSLNRRFCYDVRVMEGYAILFSCIVEVMSSLHFLSLTCLLVCFKKVKLLLNYSWAVKAR